MRVCAGVSVTKDTEEIISDRVTGWCESGSRIGQLSVLREMQQGG